MASNFVLTKSHLNMDVEHVIVQAWGDVQHKLNLGITSPMFTDLRLLYDAQRDHVNVSVSTPSSGFFGLQLDCRDPSQMSARFYGRSPMSSEIDFDILLISTTNMNILYMMAPEDLVKELSDKYQITSSMEMLQHSVTNHRISHL
ncbi:hypothetical protein CCH79_00000448 [Gambusia affinis]|uniref:Uncharacterized protein n=1 Tax=Gambusia affinis TaxID=33528 RepID=A0A315VZ52_GAMAF|nr:hypothetical protein CCH79_00000448 [Gambusia affinis]